MQIVITVDPIIPVPPVLYGGIERIIDLLVRELTRRGHEVTLMANAESSTPARLLPYGSPPHWGWSHRLTELAQVGAALWRQRRHADVVHSFGRLAALLPILPDGNLPKLQSYQRAVPWRSVRRAIRLGGESVRFTVASASMLNSDRDAAVASQCDVVFNAVDVDRYVLVAQVPPDAPLIFLGRIEPIKGTHDAIAIAKRAGRKLIIAGNRVETGSAAGYFEAQVQPHLDGANVEYAGPVNDAEKNRLLGSAAALLMPIHWEEPFGIVVAEAMACGTPVIAYARGSMPELIVDGTSGFLCRDVDGAVAAVEGLHRNRSVFRRHWPVAVTPITCGSERTAGCA